VKSSFSLFLFHVLDNSETINRNMWNLLRLMALTFACGPSWTAYFRIATAGLPLPEGFVPLWARLVLAGCKKCGHSGTRIRYPVT
jgi:hypothetical protein